MPHTAKPIRGPSTYACSISFFWGGVRVVNLDLTTFAFANGGACLTPTPISLPTQARLVQDEPDGVCADRRQSVRSAPQGPLQCGQRPCGGSIALALRWTSELRQNALLGI